MFYLIAYTWAHQWKEDNLEYLIYRPQRSQSSETSICLSIQTIDLESNPFVQTRNHEIGQYRIHKLDTNCDQMSFSEAKKEQLEDASWDSRSSWTNSYSNYYPETKTTPSHTTTKTTNKFMLSLKGN